MNIAIISIILAFFGFQSWRIISGFNSPFFDEAIYITSGLRTFLHQGINDQYLTWFKGSLLWPILAASGYKVSGLIGTRFVALFFAIITLSAIYHASKNLFDARTGFWTVLLFAVNGPFLALAHLGVYDLPALAGIAVSFWCLTKLFKTDDRHWLVVSAISLPLGIISKYPPGVMTISLIALIFIYRKNKALTDLMFFGFVSVAVLLAFLSPFVNQISQFWTWSLNNSPTFGADRVQIGFSLLIYSMVAFVLALGGLVILRKTKPKLATVLFFGLFIWPLYHLASGNPVSDNKHVVYGFLFAYPLAGVFLNYLWLKNRLFALFLTLTVFFLGLRLMFFLDSSWPNTNAGVSFLLKNVKPGQQLLINDSWPYTPELLFRKKLITPWDVYDSYRINHNDGKIGLCDYDWFVDEQGSFAWDESVKESIEDCHHFQKVYSFSSYVDGLGTNLRFVHYLVRTDIYINNSLQK